MTSTVPLVWRVSEKSPRRSASVGRFASTVATGRLSFVIFLRREEEQFRRLREFVTFGITIGPPTL